MKKSCFLFFIFSLSWVLNANAQKKFKYSIAEMPWKPSLGNHRAMLYVNKPGGAVRLNLLWRLHDQQPNEKRFLIISAATGDTVGNVYRISVNNEHCDIAFGPVTKAGKYYFYYMPFKPDPDPGYYRFGYLSPIKPNQNWVNENHLADKRLLNKLSRASCLQLQARTDFDSFYPMEIIPTASEKENFLAKHPADFLLFPENRRFPIRMRDNIPYKWVKEGMKKAFKGTADRNEYYTFQVGIYAVRSDIDSVQVNFSDLRGPQIISSNKLTCFNTGGIDSHGRPFTKRVDVAKGDVQALWMGIDISSKIRPGIYRGSVTISALKEKPQTIPIQIHITDKYLADRGDDEPWRCSRLRWLNSAIGISDKPTAPYTPIKYLGDNQFLLSGKKVTLSSSNRLPTSIEAWGTDILANPIQCIATGEKFHLLNSKISSRDEGNVTGVWDSKSDDFLLQGKWTLQFDGYMRYSIHLKALKETELKDFRLEIPFKKDVAQYMMGMGLPGTTAPDSLEAKWEGPHDSFWIGNTYGGLYCQLLGNYYHGPLLNLYKPPFPASWYNNNKGGFIIKKENNKVLATVFSGKRDFKEGNEISYEFGFIITPVKKLNPRSQFIERYYQNGDNPWPDSAAVAAGIKVINIHQGNSYNPYINYPFLTWKNIKYFTDYWHKRGMKVKIYYTTRELTDRIPEIWALRSLGNEIFSAGSGSGYAGNNGGYPWLREHLISGYAPAWYTPIDHNVGDIDAAIETAPEDSRWNNFYVHGLSWLIKNENIDGVYLDDVTYDRHIIKRMREVMDSVKPGCLIDLHSNTGFSKGPAIQYTSFFPYINKLWFGESFQYNKMSPANWLVEFSGIPFGLMSDMLQGGGNPWRGMVYGSTTRLPWNTGGITCNPSAIWKIWDSFGIANSDMIGYWNKHPVVKTTNPNVLATAYVKMGKTLISLAGWNAEPVNVKLIIDWKSLGINSSKVKIIAPLIKNFQPYRIFFPESVIPVEPQKGWLLILKEE